MCDHKTNKLKQRHLNTITPFYNHTHTHFNHILVCVTYFFGKKHHVLEPLSHSLVAQNIYKTFSVNGRNLQQIFGFPLALLMLLCVKLCKVTIMNLVEKKKIK
jgi:hypothetical protein